MSVYIGRSLAWCVWRPHRKTVMKILELEQTFALSMSSLSWAKLWLKIAKQRPLSPTWQLRATLLFSLLHAFPVNLNKGSHTNPYNGLEKLFHMTPQNWNSSSRIKYRQLSISIGPNSMGSVNQPQNKSIQKTISRNQNLNLFRRVLKLQEWSSLQEPWLKHYE